MQVFNNLSRDTLLEISSKNTRIPLYGFLMEIPVNVVISVVLIYGYFGLPAMGLAGAALGSLAAIALRLTYIAGHTITLDITTEDK